MYMAPITAAKPPVSTIARRVTGLVVLPLSVLAMAPFLAGYAVYAVAALSLRGIVKGGARGGRALVEMVDYAGQVALGR